MKQKIAKPKQSIKLRKRVEEFLDKNTRSIRKIPPTEIRNLFEEVQIYQVELEHINNLLQKTQSQLQESENRLRDFMNSATDAFVIFDAELNVIQANKIHMALFHPGMDEKELIGRNLTEIVPHLKENGRYDDFMKVIETGAPFYSDDIIPHQKFGRRHLSLKAFRLADGLGTIVRDITTRKQAETALRESEARFRALAENRIKERTKELKDKTRDLEELNTALKILLDKREEDKSALEKKILLNVKTLIEPYITKLKKTNGHNDQKKLLAVLESNLNEIISPFSHRLSSRYLNFSPTEIQVANLVKQGKTNKDIASILHVTSRTVAFHRENIRRKLGLINKKTNLKAHLAAFK